MVVKKQNNLIDHVRETYPILVDELTPTPLSIGEIQKVLSKIIKRTCSVRNLPIIFETLADYSKYTSDVDVLTEYVRQALSKTNYKSVCSDWSIA